MNSDVALRTSLSSRLVWRVWSSPRHRKPNLTMLFCKRIKTVSCSSQLHNLETSWHVAWSEKTFSTKTLTRLFWRIKMISNLQGNVKLVVTQRHWLSSVCLSQSWNTWLKAWQMTTTLCTLSTPSATVCSRLEFPKSQRAQMTKFSWKQVYSLRHTRLLTLLTQITPSRMLALLLNSLPECITSRKLWESSHGWKVKKLWQWKWVKITQSFLSCSRKHRTKGIMHWSSMTTWRTS